MSASRALLLNTASTHC